MIICFSGVGNTRYAALKLQQHLNAHTMRVAPGFYRHPEQLRIEVPDGRLIWAFPTHAWGLPKYTRIIMENCQVVSTDGSPVRHYMVTTCGDDIGLCADEWRRVMRKRGFQTMSAYSVIMPNIYTFMNGFDVDPDDVAAKKLADSDERLAHIAEMIADGKQHPDEVVRGKFPWIKSHIIHPYFIKYCENPQKFTVSDACSGCARCAQLCPLSNISMDPETHKPKWGDVCTMCTRCYHSCPRHAIDYNNTSAHKGQYLNPIFENHHK